MLTISLSARRPVCLIYKESFSPATTITGIRDFYRSFFASCTCRFDSPGKSVSFTGICLLSVHIVHICLRINYMLVKVYV